MNGSQLSMELGEAGVTMMLPPGPQSICNLYVVGGRASTVCNSQILLYTKCCELWSNSENPVLGDIEIRKLSKP